ncbi:MAG: PhoH family protein, partial [Bacteroidetes bacterium]|nr:PhoH family protein [Bacteroidota bacterium]
MGEYTINVDTVEPLEFFGVNNYKLDLIKKAFPKLKITSRGNRITIAGSKTEYNLMEEKINIIVDYLEQYGKLTDNKILELLNSKNGIGVKEKNNVLVYGPSGMEIKAKTPNQQLMVELADKNDVLFSVGPAGTGKTYTA